MLCKTIQLITESKGCCCQKRGQGKYRAKTDLLLEEMFGMPVLMDRLSRACAAASEVRREDNPMITADCRLWRSRLDCAQLIV